jgi:16S rRNA (adenine1518-N6/adenine1519-N6)-dimethyltransferase
VVNSVLLYLGALACDISKEPKGMTAAEPSPRQTFSFLMRRFREAGIRPRTKLGQNFLVDLNLVRLLAQTAELSPQDVVLEVGTGTGSLTTLMAPEVAAVVTVEVDPQLFQLAAEELYQFPNVRKLKLDALAGKHRFHPEMLEAVQEELAVDPGRQFKLVANLPYNVATPILTNLLALDAPPRSMTVTIQKELADRIAARPATKDYGALSVWVQSQCRVRVVRAMPPSVFWPRPKVSSAIVQIVLDDALRARIPDRAFFHDFLRSLFLHRRKFLRSQVLGAVKHQAETGGRVLDKAGVDRLLAAAGLRGERRAEELDVDTLLALAEAVRTAAPN